MLCQHIIGFFIKFKYIFNYKHVACGYRIVDKLLMRFHNV